MTQTLLNLVDQHLVLAYVFLFLVCMGEALFVVGLFVPSTVVLVAAGAMIGAGKLPFLPVLGVAAAGAVAGAMLSTLGMATRCPTGSAITTEIAFAASGPSSATER